MKENFLIKKYFKIISTLLIISLFLTTLPVQIFADETDTADKTPTVSADNKVDTEANIIGEVTEKRQSNVKTFIKDDMTFEAVVYPASVHYKDNGEWKDIDNTLTEQKDEDSNDVLQNKANDVNISIAKKIKADKLVKIKTDKYELSWSIDNVDDNSSASVVNKTARQLDSLSGNDRRKTLTNINSAVEFKNVYPDIDLQYQIISKDVKEYITLKKAVPNTEFTFNLQTKNLVAELQEDKTIKLFDDKDPSKEVYRINAPFMFDREGRGKHCNRCFAGQNESWLCFKI